MHAILKSICALARDGDNRELQCAAIRVLGALHARDQGVYRTLGELLTSTGDPEIMYCVLQAMEASPSEHSLRYLIKVLQREDEYQDRVLAALAKIGGKAVGALEEIFARVRLPARRKMVTVLPRIRTPRAHGLLVECFFSPEPELVRDAVHALREEIHRYPARERGELYQRLVRALTDKRLRENEAALSALVISLGILQDLRCKGKLLKLLRSDRGMQVKRHVLMSLARLEYPGDRHHDVMDAVFPLLTGQDFDEIGRYAVQVLMRIKPRRSDNQRLRSLLALKQVDVLVYALQALGQLDSVTNAQKVLDFLDHPNPRVRESANRALRNMPSAVTVILRHLDTETNRAKLFEMLRILESHANRIKVEEAKGMVRRMIELYRAGDEHYQVYRTALRHLRGEVMQGELVAMAERARRRKDFAAVRDHLKLLDHTDLMTPEIRFMLAVAKLKTSKKDRARGYRLSDYCLEHIAYLLSQDPKGFKRRFLAEKSLTVEDILYVGFHFSEQLNQERRFGVELLRHVVRKSPRSKAAQIARRKLKIEGH